jgi:hypothetical protein
MAEKEYSAGDSDETNASARAAEAVPMYYIASLKHTHKHHEHITWWGPNGCGYTPVVGPNIGEYSEEQARKLNDGLDYIAIRVETVRGICSPVPYYKPGARFYDQIGPVVDNTKTNWEALIAGAMPGDYKRRPKPEAFKGKRRSFSDVDSAPAIAAR